MENMKLELMEALLADIKKLTKEYPNDMDLGKHVRAYFNQLPEFIEEQKKRFDENV